MRRRRNHTTRPTGPGCSAGGEGVDHVSNTASAEVVLVAWTHFAPPADVEIRELAIACLRQLQRIAPNVFGDFVISTLADGSEVAASPYATEG